MKLNFWPFTTEVVGNSSNSGVVSPLFLRLGSILILCLLVLGIWAVTSTAQPNTTNSLTPYLGSCEDEANALQDIFTRSGYATVAMHKGPGLIMAAFVKLPEENFPVYFLILRQAGIPRPQIAGATEVLSRKCTLTEQGINGEWILLNDLRTYRS